jgi:serine/threonine protein kinase
MASNIANSSTLSCQPLYEEISVIGTGAYGTVYKGYDLKTSRIVAMKRIRIKITVDGLPISTIREIAYLRHLEKYDHDNIVKLLDVINGPRLASEQSVILIFEYVDHDLHNYLRSYGSNLSNAKLADIMKQIITGIDFLHTNRIIHRDLKPQNILVTKEGKVKIADFGLARLYGFTMALTSVVVTLWYRSPEVLLNSPYSSSVDIWSVGCIFGELYMKRPMFMGDSELSQLCKIFDVLGLPDEKDWPTNSSIPLKSFSTLTCKNTNLKRLLPNMSNQALDLLNKLLDFNMTNRITARDALLHPYFTSEESINNASREGLTESCLNTLPDLTNIFQPNILKRKRTLANKAQKE